MGEASADNLKGGHTWRPKLKTCKNCHGSSITGFKDIRALGDYDGNGSIQTAFQEIGTLNDPVLGDSGLYGQLKSALAAQGISTIRTVIHISSMRREVHTRLGPQPALGCFQPVLAYKSRNSLPYHNAWYGAQILQDSLRALGVDTASHYRPPFWPRKATDYRMIVVNP